MPYCTQKLKLCFINVISGAGRFRAAPGLAAPPAYHGTYYHQPTGQYTFPYSAYGYARQIIGINLRQMLSPFLLAISHIKLASLYLSLYLFGELSGTLDIPKTRCIPRLVPEMYAYMRK